MVAAALENLENEQRIPCMEKSWNLKKNRKYHGKIMEFDQDGKVHDT